MDLLSPKVDFIFKQIFGSEENKDILISFLNAVFEDSGQPLIVNVELLNPFLEKDAVLLGKNVCGAVGRRRELPQRRLFPSCPND